MRLAPWLTPTQRVSERRRTDGSYGVRLAAQGSHPQIPRIYHCG